MSQEIFRPRAGLEGSERKQLSEEVATYVRELIISGAVRSGEFLRVEPIAKAVGVSNTPVREGLLTLRSEGFLRLVPRRGLMVEPFTQEDVRDLFWAQAQLAGELAARAARKVTDEQASQLALLIERHEEATLADDQKNIARLGHAFHRDINLLAKSDRLVMLLGSIARHLPYRFYASIEGQVVATREEHPLILKALMESDSQKARSLMRHHILAGADHLISGLLERGQWGSASR